MAKAQENTKQTLKDTLTTSPTLIIKSPLNERWEKETSDANETHMLSVNLMKEFQKGTPEFMILLKTYKKTYTAGSVKEILADFFLRNTNSPKIQKMPLKEIISFLDDIKVTLWTIDDKVKLYYWRSDPFYYPLLENLFDFWEEWDSIPHDKLSQLFSIKSPYQNEYVACIFNDVFPNDDYYDLWKWKNQVKLKKQMVMLYSEKQSMESIKDRLDALKIIGEKNTHIDMKGLFDFFQEQTGNNTNIDEITDFDTYLYTIKDGEKTRNNLSEYMFGFFLDAYKKKPQQLLLKSLINYVAEAEPIDGDPQIKEVVNTYVNELYQIGYREKIPAPIYFENTPAMKNPLYTVLDNFEYLDGNSMENLFFQVRDDHILKLYGNYPYYQDVTLKQKINASPKKDRYGDFVLKRFINNKMISADTLNALFLQKNTENKIDFICDINRNLIYLVQDEEEFKTIMKKLVISTDIRFSDPWYSLLADADKSPEHLARHTPYIDLYAEWINNSNDNVRKEKFFKLPLFQGKIKMPSTTTELWLSSPEEYKQLSHEGKTTLIQRILDKKNLSTETSANKKILLTDCLFYLQDETNDTLKILKFHYLPSLLISELSFSRYFISP